MSVASSGTASAYTTRGGLPGYGGGGGVIGVGGARGAVFPSWSGQAYGLPGAGASPASTQSGARWVLRCLRKGATPASLDWESIFFQVANAVRNPSAAYKMTQLRKQAKNLWARDDPGVVMVALALLVGEIVTVGEGIKRKHWGSVMGSGVQSHSVTTRIVLLPVSAMKMWQLKS